MTYSAGVFAKPLTVVETTTFERQAQKIWTEAERAALVDHVAYHPEAGDIIPGTGGVRKLRWARAGGGKRGGARVVYFYHDRGRPVYLLLAYAKSAREDMTSDEKHAVTVLAAVLSGARLR